jgi:hypothetical protein
MGAVHEKAYADDLRGSADGIASGAGTGLTRHIRDAHRDPEAQRPARSVGAAL